MSNDIIRQIVLDTETTGINKIGLPYEGHRIIEIGAVEIINSRLTGRNFHVYLKPDRLVDPEAFNIHGISDKFLADKPSFSDVVDDFLNFIHGSELVIHNAPFDISFMDYEIGMLNRGIESIFNFCKVIDSLLLARKLFPGKRNSLDALCDRYLIDKSNRTYHGALRDAELLAAVFLLMNSGQITMDFTMESEQYQYYERKIIQMQLSQHDHNLLKVIYASEDEISSHEQYLDMMQKNSGNCMWRA